MLAESLYLEHYLINMQTEALLAAVQEIIADIIQGILEYTTYFLQHVTPVHSTRRIYSLRYNSTNTYLKSLEVLQPMLSSRSYLHRTLNLKTISVVRIILIALGDAY
jgi:hypothetical protein